MPKKKNKTKQSKRALQSGPVINVRSVAELERHLDSEDPVIVDFWATWCGPCQTMGPIFEETATRVAEEAAGGRRPVRFLKVNTEQLQEVATAFGIRSIPTLLVLHGRDVTDSHVGLAGPDVLYKLATKAIDRAEGRTLGQRIRRVFGLGGDAAAVP